MCVRYVQRRAAETGALDPHDGAAITRADHPLSGPPAARVSLHGEPLVALYSLPKLSSALCVCVCVCRTSYSEKTQVKGTVISLNTEQCETSVHPRKRKPNTESPVYSKASTSSSLPAVHKPGEAYEERPKNDGRTTDRKRRKVRLK